MGRRREKKVKSWGTISSDKENFWKKKFGGWQNYSAYLERLDYLLSPNTMWVPVLCLLTTHNRVSIGGIFCIRLRKHMKAQYSSTITP
jgi:hypothetical protein